MKRNQLNALKETISQNNKVIEKYETEVIIIIVIIISIFKSYLSFFLCLFS